MPITNSVSLTAPTDFAAEQQILDRKRRLAEALQQQSMQPLDTNQTAGGYVIPVSPYAGLAKMLQGYTAGKQINDADQRQRELLGQQRSENAAEAQQFMDAFQGTPGQAPATPNDDEGNAMPGVSATAPNKRLAMALAMSSQNPMVQGLGSQLITQEMAKQRMTDALQSAGLVPGGSTTSTQALMQGGQGPTNVAAGQIGQPTGQIPLGVSPQAWNLAIAQGDLPGITKMIQEGYAEGNKPVINRGFGVGRMVNGQYIPDAASGRQAAETAGAVEAAKSGAAMPFSMQQMDVPVYLPGGDQINVKMNATQAHQYQTTGKLPPEIANSIPGYVQPGAVPNERLPQNAQGAITAIPASEVAQAQAAGINVNPQSAVPGGRPVVGRTQSQGEGITQQRQTAGGKTADEAVGKELAAFYTGGAQDATKQIAQLKDVVDALNAPGSDLTGSIRGMLPDFVRNNTNPKAVAMRERVEEVVQRSLRAILGAQFTEKEGERLISRAYNPQQSPQENAIRVGRLYEQLQHGLAAKTDLANYFQKNGTIQGWEGKMPTMSDFDPGAVSGANAAKPTGSVMRAVNPQTGARIQSTDGGQTWTPVGGATGGF